MLMICCECYMYLNEQISKAHFLATASLLVELTLY